MSFTVTLPLWTLLPLVLSVLLLVGGLLADHFAIESPIVFEHALFAVLICAALWMGILYGRHERWLVMPILFTAYFVWCAWHDRLKREARQIVACVLIAAWLPVIYGRLTA